MADPPDFPVTGVRGLEHAADLGISITAADLPELFRRAAAGAMWLVLERTAGARETGGGLITRPVQLAQADLPLLLRAWLRQLLFWEETEGFVVVEARVELTLLPVCEASTGEGFGLRGVVEGCIDLGPRIREIKGVTLHHLRLAPDGDGWRGEVIFDV